MAVRDAHGKYAELQEVGTRLFDETLAVLFRRPDKPSGVKKDVVINPLPGLHRVDVMQVAKHGASRPDAPNAIQLSKDGQSYYMLAVTESGSLGGGFSLNPVNPVKSE